MIYSILGIDPDMNLQQILIDPGNGRTLLSQKLPMWQIMGTGNMMNPMMGNMMNPMMGNMMNPMMGNMMNPMMGMNPMMNPMMGNMMNPMMGMNNPMMGHQ